MLHPWQPANLTLAKPSRCHCQVPGALCAALAWSVRSLFSSSTFLPPRVAVLLLSPSPSPSTTNPLRLVHLHSLLFFLSFFSPPKAFPFCFLVRLFLSRRCLCPSLPSTLFYYAFVPPFPAFVFEPSCFFSLLSPPWALRFIAHTSTFLTVLSLSSAFTSPFSDLFFLFW